MTYEGGLPGVANSLSSSTLTRSENGLLRTPTTIKQAAGMLSSKAGRLLWLGAAGGSSSMVAFALANHTAETPVRLTIEDKVRTRFTSQLQEKMIDLL